jgi:hypothetical protein
MKRLLIIISVVILAGACFFLLQRKHGQKKHKEEIMQIHEHEVQKAIQELNAEKLNHKRKAEDRQKNLSAQKIQYRKLEAQLRSVIARKSGAFVKLDDIRRPHLFRSRSRKEAELAEQFRYINKLEQQEASIKAKIAKCQRIIDSLSK